jgi:DNA-binding response OmpR family regulator
LYGRRVADQSFESALATLSQEALPAIVVDVRELFAVVLVPLGTTPASWSTRSANRGPSDAGDGLLIDALAREVILHGRPIHLTVKEFALLHYLHERRGVVITRDELLRDVWGERYVGGARTVDIHIRRVRAKLGSGWVETIRGIGYKFRRRR